MDLSERAKIKQEIVKETGYKTAITSKHYVKQVCNRTKEMY